MSMNKSNWKQGMSFSFITLIFGLMLAIQFRTIQEPIERDTRDMWQLREDLKREQQLQVDLLSEIRKYEELIDTYKEKENQNPETALNNTLQNLKQEAGLTDITGPGIIITIDQLFDDELLGTEVAHISPELLRRLINELNSYDADYISINNHRILHTTVIRDINGETKIDNFSLKDLPVEVKIISYNTDKLYSRINASATDEDFAIDNLSLSISEPIKNITVPAYENPIRVKNMKPLNPKKGES